MPQTPSRPHKHNMVRRRPDDISFARISEIAQSDEACLTLFELLNVTGSRFVAPFSAELVLSATEC